MDPRGFAALYPESHFQLIQGFDAFAEASPSHLGVDDIIFDLFSITQVETQQATTFHDHPVVLMVVNRMQKASDWIYAQLNFPDIDRTLSADSFSIGGIDDSVFKTGSNALLANSFYNAGFTQMYEERFRSDISQLNDEFDRHSTALYAEYRRHKVRLVPSAKYVAQYKSLLLSKEYRYLKRAQLASDGWKNPTLEVYIHLVKLMACGASYDEVWSVYQEFTSGPYAVDAGNFPALTHENWSKYRGWLEKGYFGTADLRAQNLNYYYVKPPARWATFQNPDRVYIGTIFVRKSGYLKCESSSCFAGQTLVVLSNGTTQPIHTIQQGGCVRSLTAQNGRLCETTSAVAFVSKPKRAGRPLFSYIDIPDVRFTETHPLVESNDETGFALKFVNPDIARSMNPSWKSLPAILIPRDKLQEHAASDSDPDEVLYDLIFEPEANNPHPGPSMFIVADQNGHQFAVASEAPVFAWFPYTMRFFQHMLGTLLATEKVDIARMASWLTHPETILHHHSWPDIAKDAWDRMSNDAGCASDEEQCSLLSISQLLHGDNVEKLHPDPQLIADAFESLNARLGRRVTHEILSGWAYKPGSDARPMLLLHTLNYPSSTSPTFSPSNQHLHIHLINNGKEIAARDIRFSPQGSSTFEMHSALELPCTTQSDIEPVPDDNKPREWTLTIEVGDPVTGTALRGRSLLYEGQLAMVGLGGPLGEDEHATIDAQVVSVSQEALLESESWNDRKCMRFAGILGECFVARLMEELAERDDK